MLMIGFLSLSASIMPAFASDAGWELLATTNVDPIPRTCYKIAKLPATIRGSYYVAGPAQFELGEYKFQGLFDGFGKMNRFEFGDGEICHTAVMMNTSVRMSSLAAGYPRGVIFEDTTPSRPTCAQKWKFPICEVFTKADNNWVNMITVGDEGLLLSDTTVMLRLDLETLGNPGIKAWTDENSLGLGPTWMNGGHVGVIGSAHPVRRPGTTTWVALLIEMPLVPPSTRMTHAFVDIYTFDGFDSKPQSRKLLTSIKMDTMQYFHSYGVTPNYVVLPMNTEFGMFNLLDPILIDIFDQNWKGIYLVDKLGKVQIFDTEFKFSHVHVVNSFENDTGVVADFCVHTKNFFSHNPLMDIDRFVNKTARDSWPETSNVLRLHLHTTGALTGKTTGEFLYTGAVDRLFFDFPKVNPAFVGLPYCIYYAVQWRHNGEEFASVAVMKHNICEGTETYWNRNQTYPGEPFFVARGSSSSEDDGVLIFVALDGEKRASIFVTLDAQTMQEISVVQLTGGFIPFTAHGNFVPAKTLPAESAIVV